MTADRHAARGPSTPDPAEQRGHQRDDDGPRIIAALARSAEQIGRSSSPGTRTRNLWSTNCRISSLESLDVLDTVGSTSFNVDVASQWMRGR
jgi:hypothetical protein